MATSGRWPRVDLAQRIGSVPIRSSFGPDETRFGMVGSRSLVLDRRRRSAVFTAPEQLPAQALVHPFLGPIGATFALWDGREALHAGCFAGAGGAWGLLGDRESGKSSTLASLMVAGREVLCDDVLITDGSTAFAGPRCIDLRGPAASHLGIGQLLRLPGDRERWRVPLGSTRAEQPIRGWVYLEWGPQLALSPVPVSERLGRLAANRSMMVVPPRPAALLELASLPAFTLTRPRCWAAMPDVLGALSELTDR